MFRGGANLLFVASESEDDADIPPLVSDSEDGLMFDVIDAVEISFEAQPKRKTLGNHSQEDREDLPTLVSPEPNNMEEESAFAEPKLGSPHGYGTKIWQLCDWPDVCLRRYGIIASPVDRWLFEELNK